MDDNNYVGKIKFTAGYEEITERPYIECTDNGIGMAEQHLSRLFAHGDRRFAESHEFQVKRAAWAIEDIPFYPNSRFGVGVLSYFMLADQITVTTSRLEKDAESRGPLLAATIQGSNSIFRILTERIRGNLQQGTTIRLYLRDSNTDPNKALLSAKDWLAIPEFETVLNYGNENIDALLAGRCYLKQSNRMK